MNGAEYQNQYVKTCKCDKVSTRHQIQLASNFCSKCGEQYYFSEKEHNTEISISRPPSEHIYHEIYNNTNSTPKVSTPFTYHQNEIHQISRKFSEIKIYQLTRERLISQSQDHNH